MTEKRFEAVVDGFIDHKTGRKLTQWFEISRILNELAEENEQLKQRISELEKEVNALSCGEADWLIEEML